MKNRFPAIILPSLLFVWILLLTNLSAFSQTATPFSINDSPLPAPTSPVMDYAGVLDANTKQALEQKIIAFRDASNPKVELAVAIVPTTGDRDIFDYSLAVSRGWKIGSREQDNPSALLLIAVNDRKYYTQVSRDLEDELPDGVVGQLQRQNLVPAFRQQNYGKGVSDTIDAYIRTIQSKQTGAPTAETTEQQPAQKKSSLSVCGIGICLIVLIFIILPLLSRSSKKRGGKDDDDWGGGGAASALPWVIGSILASGSGGGSSSSSGSSGGDSGWGGFGGGGDFGGGGGGGDW
ncbi:MAG: TPM domain-containing protein [Pyrinomonadaceae bacterium]|nr:TPM domain-containing protein [Pyrinomonadaceae bacterium]